GRFAARALLALASLAVLVVPPAVGIANSARWNAAAVPVSGLPVVLQSEPVSCGPAVIATVASWLAAPLSEAEVLVAAMETGAFGEAGISLAEFANLASLFELPGNWFRVGRDDLGRLATPFVAHLEGPDGGHFVAVQDIRHGFALVADPAIGALIGSLATTLPGFSGRVYLLRGVT